MSDFIIQRETSSAIALPEPRIEGGISIRPAVHEGADFMFIDALQKRHSKMVGFMHRPTIEANITNGNVLVAHDPATMQRIGYIIFNDKYLKREELGIVYQLNVTPGKQRGLVGAALLKAAFERSAYGCKLYCCWCAQDLEANYFWESVGFVPIAFRAGSRGKAQGGKRKEQRIHIFWQRRIREGDCVTPYWFPSETSGGAMRENRIVLPIPPGTHWSDAKPAVLPGMERVNQFQIEDKSEEASKPRRRTRKKATEATAPSPARPKRGLWFASSGTQNASASSEPTAEEKNAEKAAARKSKPKLRNDPQLVAAARELRDRYTEQINAGLLLPPSACGKYDVSRQLENAPTCRGFFAAEGAGEAVVDESRLLDAA